MPPALLLLMAGKVSFGMCGGWHIWNRGSYNPKPRKFGGGSIMRKKIRIKVFKKSDQLQG